EQGKPRGESEISASRGHREYNPVRSQGENRRRGECAYVDAPVFFVEQQRDDDGKRNRTGNVGGSSNLTWKEQFHSWLTSKMSHARGWRDSWLCTRRARHGRWL